MPMRLSAVGGSATARSGSLVGEPVAVLTPDLREDRGDQGEVDAPRLRDGVGVARRQGVEVIAAGRSRSAETCVLTGGPELWLGFPDPMAARGINPNAVAPGYIETDNTAALRADLGRSRARIDRIPAGRRGQPEDIGHAAVFLASDAARHMHCAILAVDGGWLAR